MYHQLSLILLYCCFGTVKGSTGFYVDNEDAQSVPLAVNRFVTFTNVISLIYSRIF